MSDTVGAAAGRSHSLMGNPWGRLYLQFSAAESVLSGGESSLGHPEIFGGWHVSNDAFCCHSVLPPVWSQVQRSGSAGVLVW
ncbi:hypothetical protein HG826_19435 [Streptomyces sp. GMY01]|uniref:hypothetical protein n=1 Tax=Streptomyces sp. GMY02 TaxID=1333528 RepID=UPI001469AEB6|nr:hypothetical protein [Streptomyces sp. GMY02]NMO35708.1 hypothetical protein [Streptomyces sp. GMY02]